MKWIVGLFLLSISAQAQNALKDLPPGVKTTQKAITAPATAPAPSSALQTTVEYSNIDLNDSIKPRVIILLDSSGSMGQLLDKSKSKMFYAKKLFKAYLKDQWREKAEVGLLTYGSRRKKDCKDFFMAIKVGETSLPKIDDAVNALSPMGMTPIADSLELAVKQLKGYPGPKRIMIFTDGEETCGGDSCKILESAIQEKVVDLEMFVTGIGLKENSKDLDNLRCLGKTFGADSPGDLQQALDDINNSIDKSSKNGGGNNLYVECPNPKAEVRVYQLKDGERVFLRSFVASYGVKLPPGDYSADVMLDPVYRFNSFKIPPKRKTTLKVAGSGQLEVKFFDGLLEVQILDKNKKVIQNFLSDEPHILKSGIYDIKIVGEPLFEQVEQKYQIIPGGMHEIKIDSVGVVQIDYKSTVGVHIFNSSEKEIGNYLTNFPFVLKTGNYRFFVNDNCNIEGITIRGEKAIQRLRCTK